MCVLLPIQAWLALLLLQVCAAFLLNTRNKFWLLDLIALLLFCVFPSICRTNKYNKLVLAQHLDDLVESFLMSALHNGQVRFYFVYVVKLTISLLFCWLDNRFL